MSEPNDILWHEIVARAGKTFVTHRGKEFTYHIKVPKSGETSGEVVIDRRATVITRATVLLAYHGALDVQQKKGCVAGPHKLGAYGDIYLYPIFLDIGICGEHPGDPVRNLEAEAEITVAENTYAPEAAESVSENGTPKKRYCEKCGFTTDEDFDFCPRCGSRLIR